MATHGFPGFGGYYSCDHCNRIEGRMLSDSWTGKDLCFECAEPVTQFVTQSPDEEKDNLDRVLEVHRGERSSRVE